MGLKKRIAKKQNNKLMIERGKRFSMLMPTLQLYTENTVAKHHIFTDFPIWLKFINGDITKDKTVEKFFSMAKHNCAEKDYTEMCNRWLKQFNKCCNEFHI